jgi:hypothetical protein
VILDVHQRDEVPEFLHNRENFEQGVIGAKPLFSFDTEGTRDIVRKEEVDELDNFRRRDASP